MPISTRRLCAMLSGLALLGAGGFASARGQDGAPDPASLADTMRAIAIASAGAPRAREDAELLLKLKTETLERAAAEASDQDKERALALITSAVSDGERLYGKSDVQMVPVLRAGAHVYLRYRQPLWAMDLLSRAYSITRVAFGEHDPANRFVLADLAEASRQAGRPKQADTYRKEAEYLGSIAPAATRGFSVLGPGTPPDPKAAYQIVPVFYETTRALTGRRDPVDFFGTARAAAPNFGVSYVSVPMKRAVGSIPHPSVFRLDFSADPARHVIVKEVSPIGTVQDFWTAVRTRVRWSDRKETLVFIHGFNQSFQDGVETAATLAADLEIDGSVIAFSWPSKNNLLRYAADLDEASAGINRDALEDLLSNVASQAESSHVYVIAHSMGNRLLLEALRSIATKGARVRIDSIVFASPDVESTDFTSTVARLEPLGARMTLYTAEDDRALQLSRVLRNGVSGQAGPARAGQRDGGVLPTALLDVVDATQARQETLGHNDFAYMAKDDLSALIWFGLPAESRCVLAGRRSSGWRYAPAAPCSSDAFALASLYYRRYADSARALTQLGREGSDLARMAAPILQAMAAARK